MTSREWAVSIDTELPADELDPVRDHELDSLTEKLSGVTVGGRPYRLGAIVNVDGQPDAVTAAQAARMFFLNHTPRPEWPIVRYEAITREDFDRELEQDGSPWFMTGRAGPR